MRQAEAAYRHARDLDDQLRIAAARGVPPHDLRRQAADAMTRAADALGRAALETPADQQVCDAMRTWLHRPDTEGASDEFAQLSGQIEELYAQRQATVAVGTETITRLGVLERLSVEPDEGARRALFQSLSPVWEAIYSRYPELLDLSVERWNAGLSPIDRNARALGIDPAQVEPSLIRVLEAWQAAHGAAQTEPWDWWHASGEASRTLSHAITLDRMRQISDAYLASLGADPDELGVGFDIYPRPGRPPVPVAYTDFGGRPGDRVRAKPWVLAAYTAGGLGELTELIHETGHAIHIAAVDTRPAFADWPDSDALTEAIAELPALDTAEPAWQERWLGTSAGEAPSLRGRYADVMLDVCWALFEIRVHADRTRAHNDVWTELTSTYLGIRPHPELSWWAMRGQLIQEPGYMINYALAAIIAADVRAAIKRERGDWVKGDPGWYEWVSTRVYRWGLERSSGQVLKDVLGRAPTVDALVAQIGRGA